MFSSFSIQALNHVLGQHAWARDLLAPHAGKTIRLQTNLPRMPLLGAAPEPVVEIDAAGLLRRASSFGTEKASVTISLPQDAQLRSAWIAGLFTDGAAAIQRAAHVEGDAELAMCLGKIAQHLRWDPAEDLSKVTGDVVAQRVLTGMNQFASEILATVRKGRDEIRLKPEGLVSQAEFSDFAAQVEKLRLSIETVEQRYGGLASPGSQITGV